MRYLAVLSLLLLLGCNDEKHARDFGFSFASQHCFVGDAMRGDLIAWRDPGGCENVSLEVVALTRHDILLPRGTNCVRLRAFVEDGTPLPSAGVAFARVQFVFGDSDRDAFVLETEYDEPIGADVTPIGLEVKWLRGDAYILIEACP